MSNKPIKEVPACGVNGECTIGTSKLFGASYFRSDSGLVTIGENKTPDSVSLECITGGKEMEKFLSTNDKANLAGALLSEKFPVQYVKDTYYIPDMPLNIRMACDKARKAKAK